MPSKALKIIVCFFILISNLQSQSDKTQTHSKGTGTAQKSSLTQKTSPDSIYKKLWQKVDELEKAGLTKSAGQKADEIYRKAEKENNQQQMIKSLLVVYSLRSAMEENIETAVIKELKEKIRLAKPPYKNIYSSILAQAYEQYFNDRSYTIYARTNVAGASITEDFKTWDARRFEEEIIRHYINSLKDSTLLSSIPSADFSELLRFNDGRLYITYSTLFDVLAGSALNYFTNPGSSVTKPLNAFKINNAAYLAPADEFVKLIPDNTDTLSLHYQACRLFRRLIASHLYKPTEADKRTLAQIDVMRLKFMHYNGIMEKKDSLLLSTLRKSALSYTSKPVSAVYWLKLAEYYISFSGIEALEGHTDLLKKAMAICDSLITKDSTVAEIEELKNLKKEILARVLNATSMIEVAAEKPFSVMFEYRNIDTLYISIIPMNPANQKLLKDSLDAPRSVYNKLNNVISFTRNFEKKSDFRKHTAELTLPPLKPGKYTFLASDNPYYAADPGLITHGEFQVTNLSLSSKPHKKNTGLLVINRSTGMPEKDVDIEVYKEEYNSKTKTSVKQPVTMLKTDENGLALLKNSIFSYKLNIYKNGDTLNASSAIENSYLLDESRTRGFLFTDRAIYRPGQKLYFKGIVYEVNNSDKTSKVLGGRDETVTLRDARRQEVKKLYLKTNEFGTFSGEFDIPSGRVNGSWVISTSTVSLQFRVEEYKRPQFEIKLDPQKNSISLNDSVNVTGTVVTYSGAPLTNADVSYDINRSMNFNPYKYYKRYSISETPIASGKLSTDGQGRFTIRFAALPDPAEKDKSTIFTYTINVTAVDQTGETHTADTELRAGNQDLFISADLPEVINSEKQRDVKISAVNIDQQPAGADVNAVIYRLETPEDVLIPRPFAIPDSRVTGEEWKILSEGEQYEDELPYTAWKHSGTVFSKTIHINGDSVLHINEIKDWKPGKYLLTLTAKGKKGEVNYEEYFDLYKPSAAELPVNQPFWTAVAIPYAAPGENVTILAGTGLKELPVFYEVENKKGVIIRKWITLKKGQTELSFPSDEKEKDGYTVHLMADYKNQNYYVSERIQIKDRDTKLKISFESFRDRILPGAKEQWKLKIRMPDGTPARAELLASMYDMSLDAFGKNNWVFLPVNNNYQPYNRWETKENYDYLSSSYFAEDWAEEYVISEYFLPVLNLYGFSLAENYEPGSVLKGIRYITKMPAEYNEGGTVRFLPPIVKADDEAIEELHNVDPGASTLRGTESGVDYSLAEVNEDAPSLKSMKAPPAQKIQGGAASKTAGPLMPKQITARKNLQETAFFFPHLLTDENGEAAFTFTAPEALTRWKLMTFAHTKDLNYVYAEAEVVTQKEMMIQANAPRFLREGDTIFFTARVSNLSGSQMSGSADLNFFNAQDNNTIGSLFGSLQQQSFTLNKNESKSVSWKLIIPYGSLQAVKWRVTASADSSSDGEEGQLPVLTNTQLVTESMPVEVNSHEAKDLVFKKLEENSSPTLRQHRLTFEFTSNPVWYAIQALPYLIEYPYECAEQTFSRYYANSIASFLINSDTKIRQVFDAWKQKGGGSPESDLMKNEELKNIILQETPWLRDAQDETAARQRLALLFDMAKLAEGKASAEMKLFQAQLSEGGWPWFQGMPANFYITRHIVAGFGHLNKLNIINAKENLNIFNMVNRAIEFCDDRMLEEYNYIMQNKNIPKEYSAPDEIIHYLYARSYFPSVPLKEEFRRAFDFWQKLAFEKWLKGSKYMQGMTAVSAYRSGRRDLAKQIVASLKENAIISDEMGMYFMKKSGWHWYEAPIEIQSVMIEAFDEISQDTASIDLMRKWLLKNKQTFSWETTRATTEACYALLMKGTNWISETKMPEVRVGNKEVEVSAEKAEAGTGYIRTSWQGSQITPAMAKLHVVNNNATAAWGAMYWQYFERLDKITPGTNQLSLKKHVFLETEDQNGKKLVPVDETTPLKPGDLLKVRIELRADRDMEYVHMKDMRASGFEPVNVLSKCKYQDGLYYYESTKDAATNFFIENLPKGTYIFEYPLRVQYKGNFSNGITTIQSMYAPEFTSHSEGVRLRVE
ncbi:MAG: alpha-2-macroglobulin family protein [archaeon]